MHIRKILSDTTLIVFERTMYLAIILLLVQIDFKITDMMVNITQKHRQKIKVNLCKGFKIIVVQENISIF